MTLKTILYISNKGADGNSELAALKATGYQVVCTNDSTRAVALLFIMHSVAAVVLNQLAGEQTSFELAQDLRAIRPEVPIVLLCRDECDRVPSCFDACLNTGLSLE